MAARESLLQTIVELGLTQERTAREVQARQVIFGGDEQVCLLELVPIEEAQLTTALGHHFDLPPTPPGPVAVKLDESGKLLSAGLPLLAARSPEGRLWLATDGKASEEQVEKARTLITEESTLVVTSELRWAEAAAFVEGAELNPRQTMILERFGSRLPEAALPTEEVTAVAPEVAPAPSAEPPVPPIEAVSGDVSASAPAAMRPMSAKMMPLSGDHLAVETGPPPEGYDDITASAAQEVPPGADSIRRTYDRADAEQDLRGARTRDRVVDIVVHYVAARFRFAAVFGVTSKEAKGLKASGPKSPTVAVNELTIPMDLPSCFVEARDQNTPRIVRLRASGLEGGVARDLSRPAGTDILLVPIAVRQRVVLLVWADNEGRPIPPDTVGDVASFAAPVSEALERVLLELKRKSRVVGPTRWGSDAPPIDEAGALNASSISPEDRRAKRRPTQRNSAAPPQGRPRSVPPAPHRLFSGFPIARFESYPPLEPAPREEARQEREREREHEVAPAQKRKLGSRPAVPTEDARSPSENPSSFPAEAPGTLKGFPSVNPPTGERVPRELAHLVPGEKIDRPAPRPVQPRRIVPLGANPKEVAAVRSPPSELLYESIAKLGREDGSSTRDSDEAEAAEQVSSDSSPEDLFLLEPPPASAGETLLSRRDPEIIGEDFSPTSDSMKARRVDPAPEGKGSQSYSELVETLLDGDERALELLLRGGETAVGALIARFPGPVSEPTRPNAKASDCGPILGALVELGNRSIPFLTVRTADEDATVRRWATFALGELPGKESARAVASRLLDESVGVRRAALNAARRLQKDTLARRTLRAFIEQTIRDSSLKIEQRAAAIEAISDVREHEAIPTLLQLLEESDPTLTRSARWALSVLTRQDFGTDVERWRTFWQQHRDEDRVEWLISSLDHEERDIRRAAGDELCALAGDTFGFDEDQSAGERRDAQARFRTWWNEVGKANL